VYSHAPDIIANQVALPRMYAGSDLEPAGGRALSDRTRTPDRPRRPVEGRQETVPHRLDLAAAIARQLFPHDAVVMLKQLAPPPVAERRGALRGCCDVSEHDGLKRSVGLGRVAAAGQELLGFVEQGVGVTEPRKVVVARKLDVPGTGDPVGQDASSLRWHRGVVRAVPDQCRYSQAREHIRDIYLAIGAQQRTHHPRACRGPLKQAPSSPIESR
jgi:hypothetical protein